MAMATRTAMVASSSNSIKSCLIVVHRRVINLLKPRVKWTTSSSSLSPVSADYKSTNRETKKSNLTDRLSAVIEVANDRKVPPELRGQRNNVRFLSPISFLPFRFLGLFILTVPCSDSV